MSQPEPYKEMLVMSQPESRRRCLCHRSQGVQGGANDVAARAYEEVLMLSQPQEEVLVSMQSEREEVMMMSHCAARGAGDAVAARAREEMLMRSQRESTRRCW